MNDNDWIKQLQSMMERHEESVPDDLWQNIEARLPEQQAPHRIVPAWRRYAAAAAVALAVIGTGSLLWHSGSDTSVQQPTSKSNTPEAVAPVPEVIAQNEVTQPDVEAPADAHQSSKSTSAKKSPATITANEQSDLITQAVSTTQTATTQEIKPVEQPEDHKQQPDEKPTIGHKAMPNTDGQSVLKPMLKRRPMTLDLYASNSIKHNNPLSNNYDYSVSDPTFPDIITPEEIYTAKHHAPYSLGVSVRFPLTDRLSITSGLVYTRLKSDFTSIRNKNELTLHYLGIPLGLTYNIWQHKRFSVYAIGGMQADFNVKASIYQSNQIGKTNIAKDRVQFSALAGPGLQFDMSQYFGIFVEPTIRYYFDNGSDIENYFKDKPWNINLNAGLRLTLQ